MPFPRVETGWAAALVALCASSKEEELLQPGKPEGTYPHSAFGNLALFRIFSLMCPKAKQ